MSRPERPTPLSWDDKVAAFKVATASFARSIRPGAPAPMTDEELVAALQNAMGIFSGRAAPGQMHITWQGAGIKIWASWHIHNHVTEAPIFRGAATLAMARECYGIHRPGERQLALF